jgi:hypothetical protein
MNTAILESSVPVKNLKRITIYVPPELYTALEIWAAKEDRSISNLAVALLKRLSVRSHQWESRENKMTVIVQHTPRRC